MLGEGCSKSLFPSISNLSEKNVEDVDTSDGKKVDTGFFSSETNVETEGCLVVNWDKSVPTADEKKENWKGNIRFLWAVKEIKDTGAKGFVVFVLGNADNNTSQQFSGKGTAYKLDQEANKGGKISGKLGVKESPTSFGSSTTENKFPQTGDALEQPSGQKFGGLFDEASKLSQICTSTNCPDGMQMKKTLFRGYWTGTSKAAKDEQEKKNLDGGTKEIDKGGIEIFDTTKGDMSNVVKDKKGIGIKQQVFPKSASTTKG